MRITKPRTQRKRMFQAPAHARRKYFSAALSPDLKKRHGTNTFPVKAGDTVRVMRGDRQGFEGKVTRVDRQDFRVFVEGVSRQKVDGTTIQIPVHPSKVMITNLDLDDKWRREALKKRSAVSEKTRLSAAEIAEEDEMKEDREQQLKPKPEKTKSARKRETKKAPAKTTSEKAKTPRKTAKPKRKRARKAKADKGAE
jgi:large subunit ribosomal protein L24